MLVVLCLGVCGLAQAQDPSRTPGVVVEDLVGDDWKAARMARQELSRLGARAIPALLNARRRVDRAAARATIDQALEQITRLLADEVGRSLGSEPVLEPSSANGAMGGFGGVTQFDELDLSVPELRSLAALQDIGSITAEEPQDRAGRRRRARLARGALAWLGPAVTEFLFDIPPLRDPSHTRVLAAVASHIFAAERRQALAAKTDTAREAFIERYRGLADLTSPVVGAGLRDRNKQVRWLFQRIRDEALESFLVRLDHPQAQTRTNAEDALFRLGYMARITLQAVADGRHAKATSAQSRQAAARLVRRIRYAVSRELIRKVGHDLAGYEQKDYRERRSLVFELGRLGGADAIPTLRALLREEPSTAVKAAAALGLVRQQDAVGAEWLAANSKNLQRLTLTKRELAGIHMNQGLRHLVQKRFVRAEREFKRVLEMEPGNEIAWYNLACTYSLWGKIDEAIRHLEKAAEFGFDDTKHMANDRDLDNIRDDPRFKALIRRLKGVDQKKPPADGGPEKGSDR